MKQTKPYELKCLDQAKIDVSNMKQEESKINLEINFLEKQTEKYTQFEKNFPYLYHKISYEKDSE